MMKRLTMAFFTLLFLLMGGAGAQALQTDLYGNMMNGSLHTLYGPPLPLYGPPLPEALQTDKLSGQLVSRDGSQLLRAVTEQVPETLPYQVQPGDSLSRIANLFGTTVDVLMQMNQLSDRHMLKIGQALQIPNIEKNLIDPNMKIQTVMSADLTAYTAGPESTGKSPGHPAYGVTASGKYVKDHHTIAVDTRIIPMGTKVYIEGLGVRVAEDTGGAIKGNRIDVYMSDLAAAIQFGYKKNIKVYILDEAEKIAG